MLRAASSDRSACRAAIPRSSGKATNPSRRSCSVRRGVGAQSDRRHAGDRRQRRPAVGQRRRFVQVRDALLGDDMGDVVAVDHHRRDRHAGVLADLDGVERLDKRGDPALLECLGDLHDQFATATAAPSPCARLATRRTSACGRAGRVPCSGPRRSRAAGRR